MQFSNRKMDCVPKFINAWLAEIKMYLFQVADNSKCQLYSYIIQCSGLQAPISFQQKGVSSRHRNASGVPPCISSKHCHLESWGRGILSFTTPASERPRRGQGQSRFSHISTAVWKPFLALWNRKQGMPSLKSSPHCPALLCQFLLWGHQPSSPSPFPTLPQSSSNLTGLHIHTVPSEVAGNCWGPTCLELLKQGASTFKRIKL